jgi:transposase InsO family protein
MGGNDEAWAVFWCSLLSPVLLGEIPTAERERYFQKLSQHERELPNGQRRCISVRTFRRQWHRLKDEGVPGLYRRPRSDRGRPRKKHADLLDRAVELKKEQPYRSDKVINHILQREFGRTLPRSTLYHHLRREGATRRKLGVSTQKVRCRWTRAQPGALWVGDFEHGPPVVQQGEAIKTHLSAWIDCYSRFIVEARYYVRENLDILTDSLLRAWAGHGASRELYVDNAKIYHANAFKLACTQLNIKLLHRPPREPQPGGLIERFFQTCQSQFESEVRASSILSLDELNRSLAAWLAVAYHQDIHSQTGRTPHERYHQEPRLIRRVDVGAVLSFFHRRLDRKVDVDFSDVRIENRFFAVDPKLRGDRLIVEYDPFSSLEEVQLYSTEGAFVGVGKRYEREKGSHSQPESSPAVAKPVTPHYLNALRAEHEATQQRQRQQGIDFHSARQRNEWSLTSFARTFVRLLGRAGGVSGLSSQEMTTLADFHTRHDRLHEGLLREALAQADAPTIPEVLFQLQSLLHERND